MKLWTNLRRSREYWPSSTKEPISPSEQPKRDRSHCVLVARWRRTPPPNHQNQQPPTKSHSLLTWDFSQARATVTPAPSRRVEVLPTNWSRASWYKPRTAKAWASASLSRSYRDALDLGSTSSSWRRWSEVSTEFKACWVTNVSAAFAPSRSQHSVTTVPSNSAFSLFKASTSSLILDKDLASVMRQSF